MVKDVEGYLNQQIQKSDSFLEDWTLIQGYYSKRLWHQLSLHVDLILRKDGFKDQYNLTEMYENFISDFEHRINPLSLIEVVLLIAEQILAEDPKKALTFLESMKEKVTATLEAQILCSTAIGMLKLTTFKDYPGARQVIEETEKELGDLDVISSIHTRFYRLSSLYHKLQGNHAEYYREALRFLGCCDGDLPMEEQRDWAFNIGIAALLGTDVYNFGELLMHDVLTSLKGTHQEWLIDLLYAFNRGDKNRFGELAPQWRTQVDLARAENEALGDKLDLMCLMEMVFRQPATERTFPFSQIAEAARLKEDQVEFIVMKALSRKLMKGRIDEVNKKVTFTWVQPRVLDLEQIGTLQARLKLWTSSVDGVRSLVQVHAQDILS